MAARCALLIAAAVVLLWPNWPGHSASAAAVDARPPDLALGLENLHWGMSSSDAKALLPDLKFTAEPYPMVVDQSANPMIARQPYRYGNCSFELMLSFFRDGLDEVYLKSAGPAASCRWDVVNDLNAHFKSGPKLLQAPNGVLYETAGGVVSGMTTSAVYEYSWGGITVNFHPIAEINDRRAQRERYRCQDIEVTLQPATAPSPELITDPNLGCDYPPRAALFQENGTVKLQIHLLADGSVSAANILVPANYKDITDYALRLAQTRLRFLPALQNGTAVEADAVLEVRFRVIHVLYGVP